MSGIKTYTGQCHCGAVQFRFHGDLASATRCNCSLCQRKGAVMIATEEGGFELLAGEDLLSLYQFNLHLAEHYFCSRCGIYTHHKPRSNPKIHRVNAGCIEGVDPLALGAGVFDGAAFSEA